MREGRAQLGLALEALAAHLAGGDLGREHLDGHDMAEVAVARAVHGAHPARPRQVQDLVSRSDGALHGFGVGRLHSA